MREDAGLLAFVERKSPASGSREDGSESVTANAAHFPSRAESDRDPGRGRGPFGTTAASPSTRGAGRMKAIVRTARQRRARGWAIGQAGRRCPSLAPAVQRDGAGVGRRS